MSEDEKKALENDILFQIDMQLYDEFNDKIAEMNEHLGDVYSLRDIEEVEKVEKDMERKLLREAIKKQQKELEQEKEKNKELLKEYNKKLNADWEDAISKDKIRAKIEEYEQLAERNKDGKYWTDEAILYDRQAEVLRELLEEE